MFWRALVLITILTQAFATFALEKQLPNESDEERARRLVQEFFAQPVEKRYGLDVELSARGRYEKDREGRLTHRRVQYELIADGYINITNNGCIKVRGQIASGEEFDSYWDNTGLGDGKGAVNLNLRQLYIDIRCYLKNVGLQAGALPLITPGDLGVEEDGWVDGVRAILTVNSRRELEIALTAGHVDPTASPNVFRRDQRSLNYWQASLNGKLNDRVRFLTDLTLHDDNEYVRAAFDIAVNDIVHFLDGIRIEELIANGEQQGYFISGVKAFNRWEIRVALSDIREPQIKPGTLTLPIEDFYGLNRNAHIYFTRELKNQWAFKMRFRDGDDGPRHEFSLERKF